MLDTTATEEATAHAASRWPTVVRTLVLLGVPPSEAQRLAVEATARLLGLPSDRGGAWDHDTALLAEAVAAWEDDRVTWWHQPSALVEVVGYADVERALDALDPATRARLVLASVAGLTPEQVDVVVDGGGAWPAELGSAAARVAAALDPGPAAVDRAASVSRERRRRRRTVSVVGVVGVVAAAALAVGAATALVDPVAEPPAPATPVSQVTVQIGPARPVPWYDGRAVRFGGVPVPVVGLRSMVVVEDGVAGVLGDRTVVVVRRDGVQALGRAAEDSPVVGSDDSPGVAWVDESGALVVARVPPTVVRDELPAGARLVGRDATGTYVSLPDGHLVVPDRGTERREPGPVPVAVALGTRLSDDGLFEIVPTTSGDPDASTSPGTPAVAQVEVREAGTGRAVPLLLPDGVVVDAVFGQLGTVSIVLARAAEGHYDVLTCRLLETVCLGAAEVEGAPRPPLLAH